MKKNLYTILSATMLIAVLAFNGCKKDSDPLTPEDKTVPNDVFPLIAGHIFNYSGYFTNADTQDSLSGTGSFYSTSWTVRSSDTALANVYGGLATIIASKPNGKSRSALILDLTLVTPPATFKPTPIAAYYDSSSGDYYYLTNLGLFFRGSVVRDSASGGIRRDSLRFIKLASPKVGIGGTFTSFEENFVSYANPAASTTINLAITGKWESKTDVTVNGVKYSTYYLVISRVAKVGTTPVSTGVTAKLWLAKGIGPVKMFLAGDAEVPGNYRELKTKNF